MAHTASPPVISMKEQQDKLRDEEIWGFVCNACKHDQFAPMVRCPKCQSKDVGRRQFSNKGKVVSYTIQTVAAESFLNETPFAYAIVDLDDGPKIACWVPWISKPEELPIGTELVYVSSYKPGIQFDKP
jgi:uncharacterized OB-fold protein